MLLLARAVIVLEAVKLRSETRHLILVGGKPHEKERRTIATADNGDQEAA